MSRTEGFPPVKPRVFVPAILSGVLMWAVFFPLDLGAIAGIALVPWLVLVRAENVSRRRRYFAAFVGGMAFFLPALQWIRVAHPAMYLSWVFLAAYCSMYHVLALALLRRLDRLGKPPLAFTLPVVWVGLEYVRAHFPTGFPFLRHVGLFQFSGFGWYFLGHALHGITAVIQIADVGGVYVLSAFVAAVNGVVFEWFDRPAWARRIMRQPPRFQFGFFREMWTAGGVGFCLAGLVIYGTNALQHPAFIDGPRVTAIQGDVPQDAKMADEDALFEAYDRLCQLAAKRADLVVWPETCCPFPWYDADTPTPPDSFPDRMKKSREGFRRHAAENWKTHVLVGLSGYDARPGNEVTRANSAVLFDPAGGAVGRYDKMHLVPFGEYVPFRKTFPWLRLFTPYKNDYSCRPGDAYTRFKFDVADRPFTFGCLICYEDSDPYLARQYVRPGRGEPVDFLVNISNDGWFRGTAEHEQHLAICQFRAVESRRAVVRAVNSGISAVIDSDGRVVAVPGDSWSESKMMEGPVTKRVPLDRRASFYAWAGDWVPALAWVLMTAGLIRTRTRSPRAGLPAAAAAG